MTIYKGSRGTAPPFLTSALDGGEWLTSHSGHFTHCIKVCGTQRRSGRFWRKVSCPCGGSKLYSNPAATQRLADALTGAATNSASEA